MLNKKIEQKDFDAILTYWPYQAKLLAKGNFKKVIGINDILSELGIPKGMPVIGWVFKEEWAKKMKLFLNDFLKPQKKPKR